MKIKIFITTLITIFITLLSINTKAYTDEELINSKSKNEYGTYYVLDNIYSTPNMDISKTLNLYKRYLTWNGSLPYQDDDVYLNINEQNDTFILEPHLNTQNSYTKMVKPKIIEGYNQAEYIICYSNYDQILIILDGETFKGNLGEIINDFFYQTKQIQYDFNMPYESANNANSVSRYEEENQLYIASCNYQIGFNLTKGKESLKPNDPIDDPSIYGGNEQTQIDDTPTKPTKEENLPFKILGVTLSSIISIIGIYLIYLLIKKIYQIMKG